MKPGPNYRMTKQTKRMLALIVDAHKRGAVKRGAIQAELTAQQRPERKPRQR